jgi:DNA polymerase III alpha subunit
MVVDEYGMVGFTQQEVVENLKINPKFDLCGLYITDGEQYENARRETNLDVDNLMPEIRIWNTRHHDLSVEDYHKELQSSWLMPDEYMNLNISECLLSKCKTHIELERVVSELKLYEKFHLMNLLRYLKFLKDTADLNNIVWGVGRGSSCCSYCLFLLKIHRVDSIKYKLDIEEFLRS